MAIVGGVFLAPCLGVKAAVCSLRHVVLAQQVDVEELAGVVGAIAPRVSVVVGSRGLASTSALTGVVHTGEVLLADVVARGIDGSAELGGAAEAGLRIRRVVLGVAVRSSNHNLEILTVLALVHGSFLGDAGAPEGTLDVRERGWVRAGISGSEGWIAFVVDVEGGAKVGRVTELLAFDDVVRLERCQTHVGVGVHRSLEVLERGCVTLRRVGTGGICRILPRFLAGSFLYAKRIN